MALPFLKRQVRKRDRVVAIDLGDHTIKAVVAQTQGDRLTLMDYAVVETPRLEQGWDAETLSQYLKKVCGQLDLGKARQLTLAIGVGQTLFRQVEVPLMPVADLRLMLKFNAKSYLQQDLPDHVFDACYVISRNAPVSEGKGQKHRALVGGIRQRMIADLELATRTAGLIPDQVVPGMVGPANAFELSEPEAFAKEVVALVDIGFKNTTITIMDAGEIMLNRVVAIGGYRLTMCLMETMSITYEEAENIKVGMPTEVQTCLEGAVNPLGRELRASIDFFEHQQDKAVSQVLVTGGTARNECILQALQTELLVPCRQWIPTQSMELSLPPQKRGNVEEDGGQLTVAIGAAASAF